ncbi:hypothetical protein GCM10010264_35300 [Streptomyces globisporus]|nr:hypothetical protein GCM10010264_35300 [Streptomyces globisporus]
MAAEPAAAGETGGQERFGAAGVLLGARSQRGHTLEFFRFLEKELGSLMQRWAAHRAEHPGG